MSLPLPFALVESFPDIQANFEQIAQQALSSTNDLADVQSQAAALASLGVAIGAGSWTFAAAATSGTVTTPHGLGASPRFASAFPSGPGTVGAPVVAVNDVAAWDATNLHIRGATAGGGVVTGSVPFVWLAIK